MIGIEQDHDWAWRFFSRSEHDDLAHHFAVDSQAKSRRVPVALWIYSSPFARRSSVQSPKRPFWPTAYTTPLRASPRSVSSISRSLSWGSVPVGARIPIVFPVNTFDSSPASLRAVLDWSAS